MTSELLEFSKARYIRMRLQKIIFPNDKMAMLDNSFKRKLFYSIKDMSIGGRCICNGHAKKCKQMSEDSVSFTLVNVISSLVKIKIVCALFFFFNVQTSCVLKYTFIKYSSINVVIYSFNYLIGLRIRIRAKKKYKRWRR